MKPKCKLCGSAHWTYEEHTITSASEGVRKLGASVLNTDALPAIPAEEIPVRVRATIVDYVPAPPTVSPQDVPTCVCGKPRDGRHSSCAACRKRAYRERTGRG